MAEEEILDVEGEYDFQVELKDDFHDANDLPSKSANLLPEFTSPAWMLEQGWSLDSCIDEKSKATIEKMLLEEQHYMGGYKTSRYIKKKPSGNSRSSKPRQDASCSKRSTSGKESKKKAPLIPQTALTSDSCTELQFQQVHSQSIADTLSSVTTGQPTVIMPAESKRKARGKTKTVEDSSVAFTLHSKGKFAQHKKPKLKMSKSLLNKSRKKVQKSNLHLLTSKKTQQEAIVNPGESSMNFNMFPVKSGSSLKMLFGDTDSVMEPPQSFPVMDGSSVILSEVKCVEKENEVEEDVDVENDFEEDPFLPNRQTLPDAIYEHLLQSSDLNQSDLSQSAFSEIQPETETLLETASGEVATTVCTGNENCESNDSSTDDEKKDTERDNTVNVMKDDSPFMQLEENDGVAGLTAKVAGKEQEMGGSNLPELIMKVPLEEKVLPPDRVTEEEKTVHRDFFDGRPPKTPERYLKIRNYIIECWTKSKPSYLNKTRIRSGLKNCGDVNCIGRIHSYLECVGAINFGCEQAVYLNPGKTSLVGANKKQKMKREGELTQDDVKSDHKLPRKRRKKDAYGVWVDAKELEGKTITHEVQSKSDSKIVKMKSKKPQYDPFKLVPCKEFSDEFKAPYSVEVLSTAVAVMDIHSHISKTEVIGMLGGHFNSHTECLTISIAVPCKSMSTGMQCEMDPVSQTLANEKIEDAGMSVVGWYHSHPTFRPDPSVRDIDTQLKFQDWFSKGGNHFVGVIVSPYNPGNMSLTSDVQCLTVSDIHSEEYLSNIPFKFAHKMIYKDNVHDVLQPARELADKYCTYFNRVRLNSLYVGMSCLHKMLQSVKHHLIPSSALCPSEDGLSSGTSQTCHRGDSLNSETYKTESLEPSGSFSLLSSGLRNDFMDVKSYNVFNLLEQLESMFEQKFGSL
ncbi:histone H2A deubiquitinase MYSM1 isoform X2 [Aplysia californica]|uniref:Histone H2A deubiquitinase MYSM1 isoform X2 n=1 Tax=Aplysia californica TaxID=6500 RepID=A0ABM0JSH8_APLCA|nr:histone H2A deubiquitinase MYSM1 isoform X2 [Aplysia californica]